MNSDGRLRDLERRLQLADARARQYWPVTPLNKNVTLPASYVLQVTATGQQLYTGALGTIRGIFYSGTTLTTLPTAIPSSGSTYANGLGGANLVNSDGTLGAEVWLANQPVNPGTGVVTPSIAVPLPQYAVVSSLVAVSMPVSGGGFALVYLPFIT